LATFGTFPAAKSPNWVAEKVKRSRKYNLIGEHLLEIRNPLSEHLALTAHHLSEHLTLS
jgi:hypothetical protein